LITAIHNWLKMNTAGQVVIRSGWDSGWDEEYARGIAAGLILDIDAWYFTKAGQNLGLPGQGDTVVDDDPDSLGTEMVRPENMLPDQFIELMGG
jgi:hypothetical protein